MVKAIAVRDRNPDGVDGPQQQVIAVEPEWNIRQLLEGADEQTRGQHEEERHRDLTDKEGVQPVRRLRSWPSVLQTFVHRADSRGSALAGRAPKSAAAAVVVIHGEGHRTPVE